MKEKIDVSQNMRNTTVLWIILGIIDWVNSDSGFSLDLKGNIKDQLVDEGLRVGKFVESSKQNECMLQILTDIEFNDDNNEHRYDDIVKTVAVKLTECLVGDIPNVCALGNIDECIVELSAVPSLWIAFTGFLGQADAAVYRHVEGYRNVAALEEYRGVVVRLSAHLEKMTIAQDGWIAEMARIETEMGKMLERERMNGGDGNDNSNGNGNDKFDVDMHFWGSKKLLLWLAKQLLNRPYLLIVVAFAITILTPGKILIWTSLCIRWMIRILVNILIWFLVLCGVIRKGDVTLRKSENSDSDTNFRPLPINDLESFANSSGELNFKPLSEAQLILRISALVLGAIVGLVIRRNWADGTHIGTTAELFAN